MASTNFKDCLIWENLDFFYLQINLYFLKTQYPILFLNKILYTKLVSLKREERDKKKKRIGIGRTWSWLGIIDKEHAMES